jgi:hypothetical protein
MFNEIYDIVTQSDASLVATIPESILDVTRVKAHYPRKAHKLFNSVEAELDYLEGRSLHDAPGGPLRGPVVVNIAKPQICISQEGEQTEQKRHWIYISGNRRRHNIISC